MNIRDRREFRIARTVWGKTVSSGVHKYAPDQDPEAPHERDVAGVAEPVSGP